MSLVTFRRESPPKGALWRDYGVDPSRVSFVWQIRAPRVEVGLQCAEYTTEGIIFGEAPKKSYKLVPYTDDAPPASPGYYCAGRLFVDGGLHWLMRSTIYSVESKSEREEDKAVTIWDEPQAAQVEPLANITQRFTAASAAGRTIAGFARQHWRAVSGLRPIGCVQREVDFAMWSEEISGPKCEYKLHVRKDPGTFEVEGELCGVMYTAAAGADLAQHSAYLISRVEVAPSIPAEPAKPAPQQPAPPPKPQGEKAPVETGTSDSGVGALLVLGMGFAAYRFIKGRKS